MKAGHSEFVSNPPVEAYVVDLERFMGRRVNCKNLRCGNITYDTMVLLNGNNGPTLKWPLGSVEKSYKDDDGRVRVVDSRTAEGLIKRAIH